MTSPFKQTRTWGTWIALTCLPVLGQAANYFKWDMVELPVSSGASCGNGSPYRFFVNRTPFTSKTIVIFEGGGACYGQNACQYKDGFLGAINPNGIPTDYMTNLVPSLPNTAGTTIGVFNSALLGNITPFAARLNPTKVQTQSWNMVYVPYCTGDVYTGNKVAVYNDADPAHPLSYFHRGDVNTQFVAGWLKNNMPRPTRLLVAGFSAGAVGATAQYPVIRNALNPARSALLADSGPLFDAPRDASPTVAPSVPLYNKVRQAWGLDGPDGVVQRLLKQYPGAGGDVNNLGSLNTALARVFPQDRIGFTLTQSDKLFSAFAYDNFFPEIKAGATIQQRDALRLRKWRQEIGPWLEAMHPYPNIGYYIPYSRDSVLKSHTTTMLTFNNTEIPEAGFDSINSFVDNLIDGTGATIRAFEQSHTLRQPLADAVSEYLANLIFSAVGL
ncbi:pectin acetylesterase-family hydrolase [Aquabacterium sp.]|uniref:pectin acetylesterase-family hydrolase n=1 Tax=Aquabacterium sp. TaxID=1872578 RepID=UPI004037B090